MIRLKVGDYGKFVMIELPWKEDRIGFGLTNEDPKE
jgi:hypothetical protein